MRPEVPSFQKLGHKDTRMWPVTGGKPDTSQWSQENDPFLFHVACTPLPWQNTYMGYLDYRKQAVKDLGISPSTCSFNPGVMVANMTEWKQQRITRQLEQWMQRNVECAGSALSPRGPNCPVNLGIARGVIHIYRHFRSERDGAVDENVFSSDMSEEARSCGILIIQTFF